MHIYFTLYHNNIIIISGPSDQTDIERSADKIDATIEFQAGAQAPNIALVTFNLTDDEVALEAVETFVVTLEILTLTDIVQPGLQQTVVNVMDSDGI